jgi:hypothetical protein
MQGDAVHPGPRRRGTRGRWPWMCFFFVQDPIPRQVFDDIVKTHPDTLAKFLDFIEKRRTARFECCETWGQCFLIYIFVANAFIVSPFNTYAMHFKSSYTQQQCNVSPNTLYPGGIRTRVFLFLRRMRRPLRHAARAMGSMLCYRKYCCQRMG